MTCSARPCYVGFNLTRVARGKLEEAAEAQGISMSIFVYRLVLQAVGLPDDTEELRELPPANSVGGEISTS